MIDDAEHAAGLRTAEIFKSLCDHSGLTRAELDHVAETEGIPTAVRSGLEGQQRSVADTSSEPGAAYSATTRTRDDRGRSGGVKPPRRRGRTCRRRHQGRHGRRM